LKNFEQEGDLGGLLPGIKPSTTVITSLNRYERKKDINLALHACAQLPAGTDFVLVVAGGYDDRVIENVDHHLELVSLAKKLDLKVIFLRSISNEQRIGLLRRT
jgi:alpha-1,3/alpha-1,6-mannosyltransferase